MRMRVAQVGVLAAVLGGCVSAAVVAPQQTPATIPVRSVMDSVIAASPLDRTHWGVLVTDASTGRVIEEVNARKHFVPASNTKLVVTAVAMGVLGPDYRYRTPFYALRRDGAGDGVARALVLVGRGDPTWSARFNGSDTAVLDALVDSVVAAGIRRVDGPLIIDASWFDDERVHSAWEIGDLVWSYAAPVAAVAIGEGTVQVIARAGTVEGDTGRILVDAPAGLVPFANEVLTDSAGARTRIDVTRGPWNDTLRITGEIGRGAADTSHLAVTDPAQFAGRVLETRLEARGITVRDGVQVVHDAVLARVIAPRDSADVVHVAEWSSPPLSQIIGGLLKPSQNWIAEQLLKTLGAIETGEGSWSSGLAVERRYLIERAGIDSLAFSLRDGSGLTAQNLLTPEAIVQLLDHVRRAPWAAAYRAALAEPGQPGTLTRRLTALEGRLFAKTGSIANVNSLSGYVRTDDGRDLIFSVLTNGSGRPSAEVRAGIDRIVTDAAGRR